MDRNYFQKKHELWLKVLFASFSINNFEIKDKLFDFSNILFRHLKWIARELKENGIEYDYNRDNISLDFNSKYNMVEFLLNSFIPAKGSDSLKERIDTDEDFIKNYLKSLLKEEDEEITAFNKERKYLNKDLSQESIDALTMFLFEETYKEYELILIYSYMQNYTNDLNEYNIYQDLVDESIYHLKSFGNMLSILGILSVPRIVVEELYKVTNISEFIKQGIKEEEKAKEECIRLANAVKDEELGKFFNFINYQENYHIELMKKLLK